MTAWEVPTSGGITQARQRLGYEPLTELFSQVAVPVAEELTRGAFLGPWRLMAIDGFEWDAPATAANIAAFGYSGTSAGDPDKAAFPKVRVVTISECASHAVVDAGIGGVAGKGAGEQALARKLLRRLEEDWLLIADRNFYNWAGLVRRRGHRGGAAVAGEIGPAAAGARAAAGRVVPVGAGQSEDHGQGAAAADRGRAPGEDLDPARARHVRVIEYEVPDREGDGKGELIALITTITGIDGGARRPRSRRHITKGGSMRPETSSSRPTCAGPDGYCGPGARTWYARRSTATCWPTTPSAP